ncbi:MULTISPECIES: hypothetical protein [Pseudomonas]|uniref:Uncharacterized protein n=2 Tax=Pseudomonas TaxID=286 RepID=A0A1Q9WUZ7_PSERE|nr:MULTISPECIES: hypothetical protein [Pseudomonas]KAB0485738.1 hypothetical protein F7R15_12175 [Pseudomonas reinekei]NNA48202.1 hypothetical protein [Pseudomonas lactis]OLU02590.1 hypothetical protein BVK86_14035 [Pseudomonas reinekei]
MRYAYEGPATVTVIAMYRGRVPAELSTLEFPVVVSCVGSDRARIEYGHYLQGPKGANVLRLVLPGGHMMQGSIIDGRNEPLGGWLEFDVEEHELAVDQPANLNGWQWI